MTTKRGKLRRIWGRLTASPRGRLELAFGGVALLLLAGVGFGVGPAIANADKVEAEPLPDEQLPAVVAAALSCPTLTPPKLAGQLRATGAAMSDADWQKWKPSGAAQRSDSDAVVTALAHQTCALVGELRAAGVGGDLWELAVAAQHGGIDAVRAAGGVPAGQKDFVALTAGYAEWYADTDQFSADAIAAAVAPAGAASSASLALPAELVGAVNRAGGTCPTVTPARVAAQLRAASAFDSNLRTDAGEGIAQFPADLWSQYAGRNASVWDADDAIGVLGTALCDLSNQFSGLSNGDAYELALGAFQWGADTVRLAGGLPRTTVPQLATAASAYVPEYERDTRLKKSNEQEQASASPSAASPKPSRSSASPSPSAAAPSSAPAPAEQEKPKLYQPGTSYQIRNVHAGAVLELPGSEVATLASGTRVQLWDTMTAPDGWWKITAAPEGDYVIITNAFLSMSLAVEDASTANQSKLVVVTTDPASANQQWSLEDAGNGEVRIRNRNSGKVMDLLGDDIAAPNGTWNAYLVEQWDQQDYAVDQRWKLVS